jgi:hypothetical protein
MTYDFATEMANSPWVQLFLALGFMADASAPKAEEVKNVATWMGLGENIAEWFILKSGIIEAPPTIEIPIPMWYTLSRIAENMLRKGAKGVITHMGTKVAKGIVKELGFLREAKQIVDDTRVADFAKLGWMATRELYKLSQEEPPKRSNVKSILEKAKSLDLDVSGDYRPRMYKSISDSTSSSVFKKWKGNEKL